MGCKKVTVSSTPGKTKHFQTLNLDDKVTLCDCPGLVFPNFVATKAEMVCNGLLPIDQLRDYMQPVSLICQRIRRDLLEGFYGIILPTEKDDNDVLIVRDPTPAELLSAHGYIRGFMTKSGTPDQARSARYILKDYVNGVLRYVTKPKTPKKEGSEETETLDEFADFDCKEGQDLKKLVSEGKYNMLMKQRSSNISNGSLNHAPKEKKKAVPKELKSGYVKPPTYIEKETNPYDPNYEPPSKNKLTKKERRKKKNHDKHNRGNKVFVPVN